MLSVSAVRNAGSRARSAKLRAAIRTEAPAQPPEAGVFELAALPDLLPRLHLDPGALCLRIDYAGAS